MTFELFAGETLLQSGQIRPEYGPIEWSGFLAPGTYRFTANDTERRTGSLDLEVDSAATALVERVVHLR